MTSIDEIIFSEVTDSPTPQVLHERCVAHGFTTDSIRDAISRLWDEGELILTAERRLERSPSETTS